MRDLSKYSINSKVVASSEESAGICGCSGGIWGLFTTSEVGEVKCVHLGKRKSV